MQLNSNKHSTIEKTADKLLFIGFFMPFFDRFDRLISRTKVLLINYLHCFLLQLFEAWNIFAS